MTLRPGLTFIEAGEMKRLAAEAEREGARVYYLNTAGATGRGAFFDSVRANMPLDPPVESDNWDGLSDSLWSGLYEAESKLAAIFWTGWEDLRNSSPRDFDIALETLRDMPDTLADPEVTAGDPMLLHIYVCLG